MADFKSKVSRVLADTLEFPYIILIFLYMS